MAGESRNFHLLVHRAIRRVRVGGGVRGRRRHCAALVGVRGLLAPATGWAGRPPRRAYILQPTCLIRRRPPGGRRRRRLRTARRCSVVAPHYLINYRAAPLLGAAAGVDIGVRPCARRRARTGLALHPPSLPPALCSCILVAVEPCAIMHCVCLSLHHNL